MTTATCPTVLLLHGQPGGVADWTRVVAGLDGRAEVLATDRPGWDGITPPTDLAGNADAALGILDRRGTLPRPWSWVDWAWR
jgi:pimeloyl-ACP methyl ester carboxylesterase